MSLVAPLQGIAHSLVSAASANPTLVSASARRLLTIAVTNIGGQPAYVKFFDSAAAPTPGSGTPVWRVGVGGNLNMSGNSHILPQGGFPLVNGLAYVIVGGTGLDTDTAAVAAGQVIVNLTYQTY